MAARLGKKVSMDKYENYLHDLGVLIKELAIDASHMAKSEKTEFSVGYMTGFHRIVSLMQQQAEVFGIPLESIGLQGIDANTDLV